MEGVVPFLLAMFMATVVVSGAPFYTHFEGRTPSIEYGLGRSISTSTPISINPDTGRVYVAVVSSQSLSRYPVLYICNGNGKTCTRSLMNGGNYENYQAALWFSMGVSRDASAVFGASIAEVSSTLGGPIRTYRCTLAGTECDVHSPLSLAGVASTRFASPTWRIDPVNSQFILVATNLGSGAGRDAWAFFCDFAFSACSAVDVSGGRTGSSSEGPGIGPSVYVDTAASKLWIMTTDTLADVVVVTLCDLVDGSSCVATPLSSSSGFSSMGLMFDPSAPDLTLLPIFFDGSVTGDVRIEACPPRNLTGCGPATILSSISGTGSYLLGSFSRSTDLDNDRVLFTARRSIPFSTYNPILLFECDYAFSSCDVTYDIAAEMPNGVTRSPNDKFVPIRAVTGSSKAYYAFISDDNGSPGEFFLGIASPSAPRLCPDVSLANGLYEYQLDYPHWDAVASCAPGFGRVGFESIRCSSGSSSWVGTPPVCVFNATAVLIEFPRPVAHAGSPFEFWITDVNAPSEFDPGSSTPSASVNGELVQVTFASFEFFKFTASFVAPQTAGIALVGIGLNGNLDTEAQVLVVADRFSGSVLGVDSPGGALQLTAVTGTRVEIDMVDQYGNPMVPVLDNANVSVSDGLAVSLTFGDSIKTFDVYTLVPREGGGFNVALTVIPDLVLDYTLQVTYQDYPALNSPVRVNVSCPTLTLLDGNGCVSVQCGSNSINVAPVGARVASCQCLAGFFASGLHPTGVPRCAPCPSGGVCLQGLDPPFAAPGFFSDNNATFVRCKRPTACSGGRYPCAEGYTGYMCNTCQSGYFSDSNQKCSPCPASATPLFVSLLLCLIVAAAGIALILGLTLVKGTSSSSSTHRDDELKSSPRVARARNTPGSIALVFVVLQVLGILSSASFSWSSRSESALSVFNAANMDLDLVASACTIKSFHAKYALALLLPALLLLGVFAILGLLKVFNVFSLQSVRIKTLFDSMLFAVAPLVYIPLSRSTFVLFDCSLLPNGTWVLDSDPGIPCFDDRWWGVFPMGALSLIVFVLGVPAYFLICIVVRRHKLLDPATFAKYGSIYKLYRLPYYLAGVADLGKRLAIVVAAVFVSERQILQIGLLLATFVTSLVFLASASPYYYPLYNQLDKRLTLVLIVILLLGGASYAQRNSPDEDILLFVVLVITLAVFALVSLHAIAMDVYQIWQHRKGAYSTESHRKAKLALYIERELRDLDPATAARVTPAITSTLLAPVDAAIPLNDVPAQGFVDMDHTHSYDLAAAPQAAAQVSQVPQQCRGQHLSSSSSSSSS